MAGFYLFCNGLDGTLQNPFHPLHQIRSPGFLEQHTVKSCSQCFFDGLIHQFFFHFLRHVKPMVTGLLHVMRIPLQRFMKHGSHIHRGKFSQPALLQLQSVLEKMPESTGTELFQTCYAVFQHRTIQGPCNFRSHGPGLILIKHRIQKGKQLFPPGLLPHIPLIQPFPLRINLSLSGQFQPFHKEFQAASRRDNLLQAKGFLHPHRILLRKHFQNCADQIGFSGFFTVLADPKPGDIEFFRRLGEIQI